MGLKHRILQRFDRRRHWYDIEGWFGWRAGQEEAVREFGDGSRFVEVGTYLGRSICSLAEVVEQSGKRIDLVGIDTCRGSGPEGPRGKIITARRCKRVAERLPVSCIRTCWNVGARTRSF